MALETLGSIRDIVVRIRDQAKGLKQALRETQQEVARVRIAMGGLAVEVALAAPQEADQAAQRVR